jgi:hypothetical protein
MAPSEGPCGLSNTGYKFVKTKKPKITVKNGGDLAPQAITIAMYIKPAESSVPLVEFSVSAKITGTEFWLYSNKLFLNLFNKQGESIKRLFSISNVTLGKWSFVALTFDNKTVNGKQIAQLFVNDVVEIRHLEPIGARQTAGDIVLGASGDVHLSGSMADVWLFDKALSIDEVMSLRITCQGKQHNFHLGVISTGHHSPMPNRVAMT